MISTNEFKTNVTVTIDMHLQQHLHILMQLQFFQER